MQRRFNYTGRSRITRKSYSISLDESDGVVPAFKAIMNLSEFEFPSESRVIVEAYYRMMQSQRYYFGTASQITPPDNTSLGLLGNTENIKFRILVVNDQGKILGMADRISVKTRKKKTSLLPVELAPLDHLLWNLLLDGEEPVLQLNEKINNIKHIAAHDPRFINSVYPSVIRQILTYLVMGDVDLYSTELDWHANWVTYCTKLNPDPPEGTLTPQNFEDFFDWIDGVVKGFSDTRKADWKNDLLLRWELE